MAVRPTDLSTPERGMTLENRETVPAAEASGKAASAELRTLRERLAALRAAPAPPSPKVDAYSRDWHDKGWKAGWAACLKAIEPVESD